MEDETKNPAASEAEAAADKAAADKAAADKAAKKAKGKLPADTIEVEGKQVKVKFGGNIPGMGAYTKEELLQDAEAVAYLLEIGSGSVQIVEPSKEA